MTTLSNNILSICVKQHGAELSSIVKDGREYLWQADPEFWARHSPVLFPIVGMVWQKQYRSHGQTFSLGQHGFARDMDFELIEKTEDTVWYSLCSNSETAQKYPYSFILKIGYKLEGSSVKVMWQVSNPSTEEDLYFQIGAHPAFYWPLLSNQDIAQGTEQMKTVLSRSTERGYFKFGCKQNTLSASQITQGGCYCTERNPITLADGFLPLDTHSFDADALVFEDSQVDSVTLCRQDKTPYLALHFDTPVVGLWSSPGKNAPFVCLEPWYGRADDVDYTGEYENKKWIQRLEKGATFNGGYTIEIL